ncbi:PulJ/GspJ family protein [Curtobacterium sp. RRHDQ66]|uniref:PulJ/GspJ family protein n=1 Tax=Curtobacterium guangdongense TaxID=3413380 RepID=UPI003BF2A487
MMRATTRFHRDQSGVSLSELIIALSVSMIVLVAVGGFFTATLRAGTTNTTSDQNARSASIVMNSVTRYVHAASLLPKSDGTYASAVTQASGTQLTFYAYINLDGSSTDNPVQVRYSLNASKQLVQDQWAGTASGGFYSFPAPTQTPNTSAVLGGPIASPTVEGDPLFTYLGADGGVLPTQADGSLAAAQLGKIRAVRTNLELGSTTAGASGNTRIQNTLYLFNVAYGTTSGATP